MTVCVYSDPQATHIEGEWFEAVRNVPERYNKAIYFPGVKKNRRKLARRYLVTSCRIRLS